MSRNRPSTSSSQAGPIRRRRRTETPSSDEDVRPSQTQTQAAGSQSQGGKNGLSQAEVQKCATKLVRLALFHEYQHKVLRRDIITQKVLPSNAKGAFNVVLNRAQTILRQKFGMELYELRARSKGAAAGEQTQAATQTQRRPKTRRLDAIEEDEEEGDDDEEGGQATQAAARQPGSKTYILRSTLPPEIRDLMSTPQPLQRLDLGERTQAETDYVDSGALIPWDKADGTASGNVAMMGIRTVILCLVLCMGRVIADNTLHAYLKRLNLFPETLLPYSSPDGKEAHMTLDKYLDLLARQQYLEKVKIPGQLGAGEAPVFEWRWGNREAEFSEKAASEWIIQVLMGEEDDEEDEEEGDEVDAGGSNRRRQQEREQERERERAKRLAARKKKQEQIREEITRAAGGPLTGDS